MLRSVLVVALLGAGVTYADDAAECALRGGMNGRKVYCEKEGNCRWVANACRVKDFELTCDTTGITKAECMCDSSGVAREDCTTDMGGRCAWTEQSCGYTQPPTPAPTDPPTDAPTEMTCDMADKKIQCENIGSCAWIAGVCYEENNLLSCEGEFGGRTYRMERVDCNRLNTVLKDLKQPLCHWYENACNSKAQPGPAPSPREPVPTPAPRPRPAPGPAPQPDDMPEGAAERDEFCQVGNRTKNKCRERGAGCRWVGMRCRNKDLQLPCTTPFLNRSDCEALSGCGWTISTKRCGAEKVVRPCSYTTRRQCMSDKACGWNTKLLVGGANCFQTGRPQSCSSMKFHQDCKAAEDCTWKGRAKSGTCISTPDATTACAGLNIRSACMGMKKLCVWVKESEKCRPR